MNRVVIHVQRLAPGEDLRGALEATFAQLAQQHRVAAASIVSAAGTLWRAAWCAPRQRW